MSAPARQLFGTDGIRGEAGRYPLDAETVLRLGQAAADVFLALREERGDHRDWPSVVIGKDTRQSGDMLESAIAAGLNSRGVDVRLAGVIPTPAVAWLTRETGAAFGIVISASHNPFEDNGVKFFGPDGYKLDDAVELAIERRLLAEKVDPPKEPLGAAQIGRTGPLENAAERYIGFVCAMAHDDTTLFRGMKFALDAANGAAHETSEAILRRLGAEVVPFFTEPNGLNINRDCGCTHAEVIEKLVRETGANAGISHDGDADRVLLCDENGSVLDGDELMAIGALDLLERGELADNTLVATVMSNAGLDAVLAEHGGKVVRAKVGDRYVMEEMRKGAYNFGGEQSGHLIYRDLNTTGDGIVAAVQLLRVMVRTGKPLSELRKSLRKFPQAQRNLRVTNKPPVETLPTVRKVIEAAEAELKNAGAGRVLVRYSGTEPLVRILVEGADAGKIEDLAEGIREAFSEAIGA
ncbi:MAG: phosphoglucosamine mutase [Verrucomicrobiae bacterium]|nr:phosphoglucosamine mutase [Verrucomicrobiae bacterium]